jgi:hypothetical protein
MDSALRLFLFLVTGPRSGGPAARRCGVLVRGFAFLWRSRAARPALASVVNQVASIFGRRDCGEVVGLFDFENLVVLVGWWPSEVGYG